MKVGNTDSMEVVFPLFSMTRKYLENFLFYFIFAKEPSILKISARTRSRLWSNFMKNNLDRSNAVLPRTKKVGTNYNSFSCISIVFV